MSHNEQTQKEQPTSSNGVSRRKFLQILGGTSVAAGVVGCADSNKQSIYPNLKGQPEQIPGVAVWFSSTCTECSAGCGIQVRTREGRAVKVEGNPDSPVNRGGLCALGQSSLQNLYDPDRVREPLARQADGSFRPVSWEEAMQKVSASLKDSGSKKALISGETSGAIDELLGAWCKTFQVERVSYDLTQQTAIARASELVFGSYGVPTFQLEKAQVIVNFGADFLETFVSPVEMARGWSAAKRSQKPVRFVHIEPRLSLTGANADLWLKNKPGTEYILAAALLKQLLALGKGAQLSSDVRGRMQKLVADVKLEEACDFAGIPVPKFLTVAQHLAEAESTLVLAGGVASSTLDPLQLNVLVNFINLALGNVGVTVNPAVTRKPRTSARSLAKVVQDLKSGDLKVVFIHGTNPVFTFNPSIGLDTALNKASLVVAFASHFDETSSRAHLILPVHTSLESWGDVRTVPGVYSLVQPVMAPIFDTKSFGDVLLASAAAAGVNNLFTPESGGKADFRTYLQASWKALFQSLKLSGDFHKFWLESLERGGYFAPPSSASEQVKTSVQAFDVDLATLTVRIPAFPKQGADADELWLYPFPSVRTFDGRAANRPWMQEIPDPVSQRSWDSWVEIHPDTAKRFGLEVGDAVTVRNYFGEINLPVYVTPHVHPDLVAVPIGNGHAQYGRYAKSVGGGNVLSLLPDTLASSADSVALLSVGVKISRAPGKPKVVSVQGSDSQHGRELARYNFVNHSKHSKNIPSFLPTLEKSSGTEKGLHGSSHGEHQHEPVQMYEQRKHPLYEWGLAVDLSVCTGCTACVVACYAENNIATVGRNVMYQGREMSWLRIERYFDGAGDTSGAHGAHGEGADAEELHVSFLPMMCQQCHNAPCEPVCPVFATYHNEEGLNAMVYNRCVGTRYCSNNCSYKVRRFNWFEFELPEPLNWQLNPDVTKRSVGVMEKCTFCVQRIHEAKDRAKDAGRLVRDGEVQPACVQSCPTQALAFGNLNDPNSRVAKLAKSESAYKVLDHHLNTQPAVTYLERVKYDGV